MADAVADSSALLACIRNEPGAERAAREIRGALLCSVNYAESLGVLVRQGLAFQRAREVLAVWNFALSDFDTELAEGAAALLGQTRHRGLSLADCACLALGARERLPVLTADKAWRGLDVGVEFRFIR